MLSEDCCSEHEKETISNKACFCFFPPQMGQNLWEEIMWTIITPCGKCLSEAFAWTCVSTDDEAHNCMEIRGE